MPGPVKSGYRNVGNLEIKKGPQEWGDPAPGCGVFLSFLFEVNLLPFLGAVNGTDTVDISAFKLRRAHIPITPFIGRYPSWCFQRSWYDKICGPAEASVGVP